MQAGGEVIGDAKVRQRVNRTRGDVSEGETHDVCVRVERIQARESRLPCRPRQVSCSTRTGRLSMNSTIMLACQRMLSSGCALRMDGCSSNARTAASTTERASVAPMQ